MPDPLSAAERYRSDAAKFFELAKDAPNPFIRDYYNGLAKRYLMHAENQEIARTSEVSAATEVIPDSPSVQAAPESSPEEEASDGPAPPTPLQPGQGRLMLPTELGAAAQPAPRGDQARPRHRRRYQKINFELSNRTSFEGELGA